MLKGKNILLGISGGIAAYKIPFLIRLLVKNGAHVKVVVTHNALEFVTITTLESLSQNKVYEEVFAKHNDYTTEHVAITDWADIFVIAPATANIIGKMANGIADDALSTSFLAFDKKVLVAPAMNCKMWDNKAVQKNCQTLATYGVSIIEPPMGFLACGYEGKGRMAEPEDIFKEIEKHLSTPISVLSNKNVLVTAGPTFEAIDPVRFIGNNSSGLMGFALAETFASKGAHVTLISGPTHLTTSLPLINTIRVTTADAMYKACLNEFPNADITVMAAAVADYTPLKTEKNKIKKSSEGNISIELKPTKDILKSLGKLKKSNQILVGFALETENEIDNATQKLKTKNLDCIVLNSLKDVGAGFGTNTNKITIIDANGAVSFQLKNKMDVAEDIVEKIASIMSCKTIKMKN